MRVEVCEGMFYTTGDVDHFPAYYHCSKMQLTMMFINDLICKVQNMLSLLRP